MNILPDINKKDLKRGLRTRFVVVALIILSASFIVGTVLLVPAYVLTRDAMGNQGENFTPEDLNEQEILKLPQEIKTKLWFYQAHVESSSFVETLSKILNYKPAEVSLHAFSYTKGDTGGTNISMAGIAKSRSSLVTFESALSGSGEFSSVSLPVSSLTKERNLPFSLDIFIEENE